MKKKDVVAMQVRELNALRKEIERRVDQAPQAVDHGATAGRTPRKSDFRGLGPAAPRSWRADLPQRRRPAPSAIGRGEQTCG